MQTISSGEIIEAESRLIKIDPTEYELAVARLEANIAETRTKINELAEKKGKYKVFARG
ncbi:MAG: hypothetical protein K9J79_06925 [Desulfobacteraceae bacterium]|nr:hypothetical protein [Desulfobacteraceae bacterium]MCF8095082.1 hypothetical protein [Desulfobacteraceae bacterium]